MADIYTEQGITQTPTVNIGEMSTGSDVRRASKIFDAIEEHAQQNAEKHQKLANTLYEGGSNLAIHQGLETLSNDPAYASNPQAFAKEADKMASKVYSDIQNPEIKANVILKYEMSKGSYVNRAYSNYYKKQHDEQLGQTLESVDENFDNIALSFGNLMNDNYSVDDYIKLRDSIAGIDKALNQKDIRGFDLLSESEKRAIENRKKTLLQHAVINGINSTPLNERIDLVNRIAGGEFEMIKGFEDTIDGREIFGGGLDSYLKPESVQYIKAYAMGLKDRYDKLKSTKNRDTGLSDRQAMDRASTQTIYDLELPEEVKEIGKIKDNDDRTFAYMSERLRAINLFKNKDIDEKTFKNVMDKSAVPLVKDIESTESTYQHWYKPNGAYRDGVDVLKTLNVQTNEEKAYLYTNLFDALSKDGIEMDSTNSSDKKRAKDLALEIKQEYLENKNPNLVGTDVSKVLLGQDVLEAYKPKKELTIAKPKWKVWVRNDGTKYKILPDKNGEYTSDSVFIRIGE